MGIDDKYNSLGSSLYESDYILFDTEEDDDLELDVSFLMNSEDYFKFSSQASKDSGAVDIKETNTNKEMDKKANSNIDFELEDEENDENEDFYSAFDYAKADNEKPIEIKQKEKEGKKKAFSFVKNIFKKKNNSKENLDKVEDISINTSNHKNIEEQTKISKTTEKTENIEEYENPRDVYLNDLLRTFLNDLNNFCFYPEGAEPIDATLSLPYNNFIKYSQYRDSVNLLDKTAYINKNTREIKIIEDKETKYVDIRGFKKLRANMFISVECCNNEWSVGIGDILGINETNKDHVHDRLILNSEDHLIFKNEKLGEFNNPCLYNIIYILENWSEMRKKFIAAGVFNIKFVKNNSEKEEKIVWGGANILDMYEVDNERKLLFTGARFLSEAVFIENKHLRYSEFDRQRKRFVKEIRLGWNIGMKELLALVKNTLGLTPEAKVIDMKGSEYELGDLCKEYDIDMSYLSRYDDNAEYSVDYSKLKKFLYYEDTPKEFILNKNVKDIVDRPYAKEPRIREIKAPDVFMKNFIEKQPGLFDKNSIINGKGFSEYKEKFQIKEPTFEDDRFDFKLRDDNRVGKNIDRDSHAEGIDDVEMTEDDRFDYKMRDDNAVGKNVDRDSHAEGIDGEDITKDDRFDFKVRGDNATGKDEDRDMNAEGIDGKEISEDSKTHSKEEKKEERSSWDDELSFS